MKNKKTISKKYRQKRSKQIKEISRECEKKISHQKKINNDIAISLSSLSSSLLGLFYPFFNIVTVFCVAVNSRRLVKDFYKNTILNKKITTDLTNLTVVLALLYNKSFVLANIPITLSLVRKKFTEKIKDNSSQSIISVFNENISYVWKIENEIEIREDIKNLKKAT